MNKELKLPVQKYLIGDEVWWIEGQNIYQGWIMEATLCYPVQSDGLRKEIMYSVETDSIEIKSGWRVSCKESQLFPSKESLKEYINSL